MIGKTISHYKILEKLGGGGMGVVYMAQDLKLDRFVALKFLPPHLGEDEEAKTRFIQEAKAASVLDHPNICTIYEIGETEDDQIFIAMAYYEGETLKKKVSSGQLSVNSVIDIAIQMAQGLAKVHEKGIVHRDIKPTNVMITKDGVVKILDFGLAKLAGAMRLTKSGATMGTVAYMSPEQVHRLDADHRTDIWSLGVVMYEMLTGQLPFEGEYEQAIMYGIANDEPQPVTSLRAETPIELERLVNQCLAKEPADRYQAVSEVQADLGKLRPQAYLRTTTVKQKPVSPASMALKRRTRLIGLTFGAAVLLLAAIGIYFFRPEAPQARPMKTVPFTSMPGVERFPAFSPDGRQIAFMRQENDTSSFNLYVQLIGTNEPLRLTNHRGDDICPVWSSDGRQIAFSRLSDVENERWWSIHLIPALGGAERKVYSRRSEGDPTSVDYLSVSPDDYLSWSPDGKLLAFTNPDSSRSLVSLSLETLEQRRLTSTPIRGDDAGDFYPAFSPDGSKLAFVRRVSYAVEDVYALPIAGGEPERITFDGKNIQGLCWTPEGREIIFSSDRSGAQRLWRITAGGGSPKLLATGGQNPITPTISPDGTRLAYTEFVGDHNIYHLGIPESPNRKVVPTEFSASTQLDFAGYFSPDGKRMAFDSNRSGYGEIWISDSDGRNLIQLTFLESESGTPRWSPDGKQIAFDSRPEGNGDIFVIPAAGGTPKPLTMEPSDDILPSWSRDGRWLYFSSDRSGESQIWKIPSGGGVAAQVTRNGGFCAYESGDGRWLYYTKAGASSIWKIRVTGGDESLVLDHEVGWWNWALFEEGIYYLIIHPRAGTNIEFLNFATNETKTIAVLDVTLWGLSITPDRQRLFSSVWKKSGDIKLVENFR